MELFFAPMACSLATRIALYHAALPASFIRVALQTKDIEQGGNLFAVNPKGQVPALRLPDGTVFTEGPALLQYIADLNPNSELLPSMGSLDRYRVLEWLNYTASEIHKAILWFTFSPESPKESKVFVRELAKKKLEFLNDSINDRNFLVGARLTIADAYMFWALTLLKMAGIELDPYTNVNHYIEHISQQPAVQRAVNEEMKLMNPLT
jgi:glutathione S-transferase